MAHQDPGEEAAPGYGGGSVEATPPGKAEDGGGAAGATKRA